MSATKDSVLLYTIHEQFTQPYNLPDVIQAAPFAKEDQVNATLDKLVEKHREWIAQNNLDINTAPNASFFIVADENTLSERIVQVVYLGPELEGNEKGYDVLRSPISAAVQVYTTIDGGQQGWEEFVFEAQSNGGIIPSSGPEEPAEASQASATGGSDARMQLPTKPRT
ncbi:hypothetical protein VNI00_013220 [Paramarasmius palmivorus]|uniref:Uncharacterized protein n=1 Tax=Paramarasmius palmivorus TaxID=297713 RepID=A0AAW0C178_9AGAR